MQEADPLDFPEDDVFLPEEAAIFIIPLYSK